MFTVVIPTYNRCEALVHTLKALASQTYSPFEVVVVVDGGSDNTAERLATLGAELPYPLRYVVQPNAGPARARNHGAELAQGDFILFIDDDIEAAPALLAEHARLHREATGRVVIGVTPAPPDGLDSAWAIYEATTITKHYGKISTGVWSQAGPRLFYTGNSSLARADFWRVGGFDATLRRGEDIELGYRLEDAGLKFILNERAIGLHLNGPRSLAVWKRIPYTYGRLDAQLDLLHDRYGVVANAGAEFNDRHWLNRWLVRLCLGHSTRSRLANELLDRLASLGRSRLSQRACSALFNLNYYQGLADELGSTAAWWSFTNPARRTDYQVAQVASPPLPGISVVICTDGRQPTTLRANLENLLVADYPSFEIIVADLGEPGPTAELLATFGDVPLRHLMPAKPGRAQAIELALKLAQYPILALTEEDCQPSPDWLAQLGRIFAHRPEVGLVVGPVAASKSKSGGPTFEVAQTRYISPELLGQPSGYGSAANLAVRRAVFARLLDPADDFKTSLTYRAAHSGVIALESPRPTVTRVVEPSRTGQPA